MRLFTTAFLVHSLIVLLLLGCSERGEREASQEVASQDTGATEITAGQLKLPPHFLDILRQEMIQLSGGMGALLTYMVRGEADQAAQIAMNIHDSFILKQELSEEEMKELVSLLPEKFIRLDRGFHELSAEISAALKNGDFEKSGRIYGQMVGACLNCHTQFAAERFPGLAQ